MNNTTTISKPTIQVLYDDPNNTNQLNLFVQLLLFFSHYLIAIPVFLLCWFAVIGFLKKRGHISPGEAQTMVEELTKMPRRSPVFLLQK